MLRVRCRWLGCSLMGCVAMIAAPGAFNVHWSQISLRFRQSVTCSSALRCVGRFNSPEVKQMRTSSGKTVHLECAAGSTGGTGQGIIYYAGDGSALYKSAGKGMLPGT